MSDAQSKAGAGRLGVSLVQTLEGHQGAVYDLCLDDFGHLLSAGGDGLLVRWEKEGPQFFEKGTALAKADAPLFALAVLADGGVLAGTGDGGVLQGGNEHAWSLVPANEGGTYVVCGHAVGGADGRWLDRRTGEVLASLEGRIRCWMALSGGDLLGTSDGLIHRVGRLGTTPAHKGAVRDLMPWPGKDAVASVGGDGQLRIWSLPEEGALELIIAIPSHKGAIYRAKPSPDGRWVATCSRDRSIALWDAENLTLMARVQRPAMPGHLRSVNALAWVGSDRLASAGDDGKIMLWKIHEPEHPASN